MKTIFCVCDWTAQYKLQNTHTVHTCMHLYIHIIEPIEKALGYKIIIIVKRTAAPFGILFGVIVNVCAYVCVDVGILWILKIVSKYVNNVARFFHSFALSLSVCLPLVLIVIAVAVPIDTLVSVVSTYLCNFDIGYDFFSRFVFFFFTSFSMKNHFIVQINSSGKKTSAGSLAYLSQWFVRNVSNSIWLVRCRKCAAVKTVITRFDYYTTDSITTFGTSLHTKRNHSIFGIGKQSTARIKNDSKQYETGRQI